MTTEGATRVCDGSDADGIIVNAVLISSNRRSIGSEADLDVSIRPGDNIDGRIVDGRGADDIRVGGGTVSLTLNCLKRADSVTVGCVGDVLDPQDDTRVRYIADTTSRGIGSDVVVLIDLSGDAMVSDVLKAGAVSLVRRANARDQVSVFGFDELIVRCTVDVAGANPIACDPSAGLHRRSSLWQAVVSSHDLLRTRPSEAGRAMRIVVLTNGPDSCGGEVQASCTTPCVAADPQELAARIAQEREDPKLAPIHIDFVQLDTVERPGRDARQVALACASGGHYQFINASTMPLTDNALHETVEDAVSFARLAWMGHWELAQSQPAYSARAPGAMYGLEGALEIDASSNLRANVRQFPFGIGMPSARDWDRRPTLLKPCTLPSDCDPGPMNSCMEACSGDGLCRNRGAAVPRPNLSSCEANDGMPGFCCSGDCRTSGQCEACSAQ